jgi:hypothetical protein
VQRTRQPRSTIQAQMASKGNREEIMGFGLKDLEFDRKYGFFIKDRLDGQKDPKVLDYFRDASGKILIFTSVEQFKQHVHELKDYLFESAKENEDPPTCLISAGLIEPAGSAGWRVRENESASLVS